jgi:hypothetical protein
VDDNLEYGLRLHTEPEHKDRWAINEIDAHGRKVGEDQIPWPWTLSFTATSCVLGDSFEIRPDYQNKETEPPPSKIEQRQVIHVRLRPGSPRGDDETTFSMFGTDRTIKSFDLLIRPIEDPAKDEGISGSKDRTSLEDMSLGDALQAALEAAGGYVKDPPTERCTAWGYVSRKTEFNFVISDDCVEFHLYVKPETFARYGAKVAHGLVDEIVLRVGKVSGFYSEWSRETSTDRVKVLTAGQKITLPPGLQFEPPRLRHVGEAQLYINRHLEFRQRAPSETVEEVAGEPQILQLLGSLRRAAWFIISLLALIFIITLSKH